jgi:hypothetical protein
MAIDSMKATSAMTTAADISASTASKLMVGTRSAGSPARDAADDLAAAGQRQPAGAEFVHAPLAPAGGHALRRLAGDVERAVLRALEAQQPDVAPQPLVGDRHALDVEFGQMKLVAQRRRRSHVAAADLAQARGERRDLRLQLVDRGLDRAVRDDERARAVVADRVDAGIGRPRVAGEVADDDRHGHRDQHAQPGQAGDALQTQHQRQRQQRHRHGRQVGVRQVAEHFPDVGEEGVAAPLGDAEQEVELRQRDDDRRGVHEAQDHRVRDEVDDGAEPERAERELDGADHQRQQQRQLDVLVGERHRQRRQRRRRHQRDDGHRAGGELARRTPERTQDRRHEGDVQPEVHRQPRQLRIGHGLGHQHQRAGDAGDDVAAQHDRGDREPGEKGEYPLQPRAAAAAGIRRGHDTAW